MSNLGRLSLLAVVALLLPACGSSGDPAQAGDLPPVANAGIDQAVNVGTSGVALNAGASSDPEGGLLTYSWQILSRPFGSNAFLTNTFTAMPTFTADVVGTFKFRVSVTDSLAQTSTDDVDVVSNATGPTPTASAGPDVDVQTGAKVILTGLASTDPVGGGLQYTWTSASYPGSAPVISIPGGLMGQAWFTPAVDGDYVFDLTVFDGTASDVAQVTLHARPLLGTPSTYTVPVSQGVLIGDVSFDGRRDLVIACGTGSAPTTQGGVYVGLQQVNTTLAAPPTPHPSPTTIPDMPASIVLGDFNGDGRTDVAVEDNDQIVIYYQNASGGLDPATTLASAGDGRVTRLVTGDFNNDGRADLATEIIVGIIPPVQFRVEIFLQAANGTMASAGMIARPAGSSRMQAGDVNGDGRTDLVFASSNGLGFAGIAVMLQLPGGGFGAATETLDLPKFESVEGIWVGDLTGDGRDDIAVTWGGNRPAYLSVYAQNASGGLNARKDHVAYEIPSQMAGGDVNGDGRADLVVTNEGWLSISLYCQSSSGTFGSFSVIPVANLQTSGCNAAAIGDLNGDGKPDVALADPQTGVQILYNVRTP